MTKSQKCERFCPECKDNFYNKNVRLGAAECWHLKKARIVKRVEVHINQHPPWPQEPIRTLDCFHRSQFIYVDPKHEACHAS